MAFERQLEFMFMDEIKKHENHPSWKDFIPVYGFQRVLGRPLERKNEESLNYKLLIVPYHLLATAGSLCYATAKVTQLFQ